MSIIREQCRYLKSDADYLKNLSGLHKIAERIYGAIETIQTLSTKVRANNLHNCWIPCSERLPEESLNSVIGWDAYRNRSCFVQYYCGRWILGNDVDSVKIIAWMPLPEPYEESEEV